MINSISKLFFTDKKMKKNGKNKRYIKSSWLFLFSALLSFATINPTGFDLVHRLMGLDPTRLFSYLEGFVLFLVWVLAFYALKNSVGWGGIFASMILSILAIGGLVQEGYIDFSGETMGWSANIAVAIVTWFGLVASRIWLTITGQYDIAGHDGPTDEIDIND